MKLSWSVNDLARATGLSKRRIQMGLARARNEPYDLPTIWQIEWRHSPNPFRTSGCEVHSGTIPAGLPIGCLACLESGLDHLIRIGRKPEAENKVYTPPTTVLTLTRKQKRAKMT
jgi:hypothetical protein